MSRTLLVPIDDSPMSWRALEHAFETDDARVVALHVVDPWDPGYSVATDVDVRTEPPHGSDAWYERADAEENRVFERAREIADGYDAELETDHRSGDPAREIVDYVEENDVDHVVMGSHGRTGPTRLLLGSVAELVVRRAPVPVTVVRDTGG
ncbi:universal stress protein [Natrarchaeobius sp. A-rgal3]|uniref:universal stress protein n=1 Tax=Natrarchaeobius versutus TaxID=1679078 RepID=UPI00350F64B5